MSPPDYAIEVDVASRFLADQSAPEEGRFVFSYTIRIRNCGTVSARLLDRHWVITDANNTVQEVRGEGVIGEQPWLRPGDHFEYTSGTVLKTPQGTMRGSYGMLADDGTSFDAPVAEFVLSVPRTVH